MIVWRVTGSEIGPDGNGAAYFTTKREAEEAAREWHADHTDLDRPRPARIEILNRQDLADWLNDAMGYGVS